MKRALAAVVLSCSVIACGGDSSTSPTPTATPPTPAPAPTTFTLSGRVTSNTGTPLAGAVVRILDGSNANRSIGTSSDGSYSLTGLNVSGFTANATASGFVPVSQSVTLTSSQVVNFSLTPTPLFTISGTGDNVFDIPLTVTRIRIQATYRGSSSNFIVHIAGAHVVNELLGTFWGATTFDGTYAIAGGLVEITNSSGVAWTFTEVR